MSATERPTPRSAWRWFPWYVAAALGIVVVVNAGMSWIAVRSFPGEAVQDSFDHSNDYDTVLEAARQEAALGWSIALTRQDGHEVLSLTDRDGRPLTGADISVIAQRPLGPDMTTDLKPRETGPGRYEAMTTLPLRGQWDLLISAQHGAQRLHATRRVVVP